MKKILFSAISALAVASVASAADSTQFGVMKVPSTAPTTIVSVPWIASGTGTSDVKVSDLVLTSGLAAGDELYAYENGAYSAAWHLVAGTGGVLQWEPYTVTDGVAKSVSAGATDATIPCGHALMLKRMSSPITGGFCIMGKPISASSVNDLNLASGSKDSPVWSLIAPPVVADVNPNTSFTWTNLAAGLDVLMVPNTTTGAVTSYTWSGVKFKDSKNNEPTIKAGVGAWFVSRDATSGKKVKWSKVQ